MELRRARIQRIGSSSSKYADYNYICKELEYSHQIFTSNNWKVFNVTGKSVEETATEIIDLINKREIRLH